MRILVVLLTLFCTMSVFSCKEKKNEVVESKQVVKVAKSVEVEEIQEEVVPEKEMNYFLVAGCFEVESNAEKYNKQLLKEGYNSQIIPFYGMNMVTFDGYETREEAQRALNLLVQEAGKEFTWVYPLK